MKLAGKFQIIQEYLGREWRHSGLNPLGYVNLLKLWYSLILQTPTLYGEFTNIQIEPTTKCNLRCTFCERTYWKQPNEDLTYADFEKIISGFKYLRTVDLTGIGETLMNKEFFKMLALLKKKKIHVRFNDNATLLNKIISTKLIEGGLDEVLFSFDGGTKKTYESIRVGADFDKVKANIKEFVMIAKQKKSPIKIRMISVANAFNVEELPQIVGIAHELGIREMSVQGMISFGAGIAEDKNTVGRLDKKKVHDIFERTREKAHKCGIAIRLPPVEEKPSGKCQYPWISGWISNKGDLTPCCLVTQRLDRDHILKEYSFGKLTEKSYGEFVNSSRFIEFRRKLASKKWAEKPEICKSCPVLKKGF